MSRRTLSAIMLILCLDNPKVFAAIEPLADVVRRCSVETDEVKRLACFDTLASTLPKIESDQVGMTADIAHKRDPITRPRSENLALSGKIVALVETPRGEYLFTLDNGQIWIQTEQRSNIRFDVGEAVLIQHGAMGSFWLATDHHRKTRVKRIQ